MYLEIISLIIEINTSLLFGFSLTDIKVSKIFKKTILISIVSGVLYYFTKTNTLNELSILLVYLALIPMVAFILKIPILRSMVSILLALVFNLSIIKLLQHNVVEMLLMRTDLMTDVFSSVSIRAFEMLNNIVMTLIIYNNSIVLFPETLFSKSIKQEASISSSSVDVYSTVFILLILNFGLSIIFYELPYFRYNFRILSIFWSIIFSISILFYQSKSIKYKNQITEFLIDYKYQEDILAYYAVIRSQRHDFNFHLNSLYSMILNKDFEESKHYIEDIVGEARYINDLLPIYHPAIGAMLNTFKEIAAQKKIRINYYIMDDLRKIDCSVFEINKILGNLIQNAIDELELELDLQADKRVVDVEIYSERGDTYIIKVTNPTLKTEEELQEIFNLDYSTKDIHEGIGLPTVKNILLKYNGSIYTELDHHEISFIVRLPIR